MHRNNLEYKVGEKNLIKRKKTSKEELEFMGPFLITQINDNFTFVSKRESSMMPQIFTE